MLREWWDGGGGGDTRTDGGGGGGTGTGQLRLLFFLEQFSKGGGGTRDVSTNTGVRAGFESRLCDLFNYLNFTGLNFIKCKIRSNSSYFIELL